MTDDQLTRFMAKVEQTPSGCWLWTGARTGSRDAVGGYGNIRLQGRSRPAHRVSYEHFIGPIPEGLVLDHVCRNRLCVNPDHLEAVTQRENILRGEGATARNARATHCPEGHPYEVHQRTRGVERMCRVCARRSWREYGRRKRSTAKAAA